RARCAESSALGRPDRHDLCALDRGFAHAPRVRVDRRRGPRRAGARERDKGACDMKESAACIFCRIFEGKEKASFVAQGADAVAFLDLHPINEGHTLVVPRKHAASIGEVDEISAVGMWSLARRVAAGLRASGLRCEALTFSLADG